MTRKQMDRYSLMARQEIDRLIHVNMKCSLHIEMHFTNEGDKQIVFVLFIYPKDSSTPIIQYMHSSSENARVLEMLAELRAKVDEVLNENRDTK